MNWITCYLSKFNSLLVTCYLLLVTIHELAPDDASKEVTDEDGAYEEASNTGINRTAFASPLLL